MSDPYAAIAMPVEADPYAGIATPAPPRRGPVAKPNVAGDVGQSFLSGVLSGVGQIADAVDPVNQMIHAFPGGPVAQIALKPLEALTAHGLAGTLGGNRQPETTAGRYAKTIGEFTPNAAVGGTGGVVRRAAQVVVPAVASEAAGQLAENAGAPAPVQAGARLAGAVAGGGLTGMRLPPRQPSAVKAATPSLEQLQAQKTAAYKAVDQMGVTFKPQAATSLATDISNLVHGEGGAALYPKAAAMAQRVQQVIDEGPLSLTKLDKLRAQVGQVVIKDEPHLGYAIRDKIDSFIDGADPSTVEGGGMGGAAAIQQARALNTRYKKVETVTNALESGDLRNVTTNSGKNGDNTVRQKLRPLLDPTSPRRMRNLTPEETAALNKAVRGSPGQNLLRQVGKFAPNGLMGLGELGLTATAGPVGAVPGVVGAIARPIAEGMTRRNVEGLLNVMATGGKSAMADAPATFEDNVRQLRARLAEASRAEAQRIRQRLLMGTSGLLASGGSAAAQTPAQGLLPQTRRANQR